MPVSPALISYYKLTNVTITTLAKLHYHWALGLEKDEEDSCRGLLLCEDEGPLPQPGNFELNLHRHENIKSHIRDSIAFHMEQEAPWCICVRTQNHSWRTLRITTTWRS